jgi:hypothetical protein
MLKNSAQNYMEKRSLIGVALNAEKSNLAKRLVPGWSLGHRREWTHRLNNRALQQPACKVVGGPTDSLSNFPFESG